jgi:microcin C transport system substrate-binding protein
MTSAAAGAPEPAASGHERPAAAGVLPPVGATATDFRSTSAAPPAGIDALAATVAAGTAPMSLADAASGVPPGAAPRSSTGTPPWPRLHALSWFGETRYPAGFEHFDWANPDAPKGGRIVLAGAGTFDSLNALIATGKPAAGLAETGSYNWIYDRLLEASADDAMARYCRLAAWVQVSPDYRTVIFGLRPEARWHDGVPITADDVVFAFEAIRAHGSPTLKTLYRDVVAARATGPHEVRFEIAPHAPPTPAAAMALGELYPLPRHWWAGHDISRSTLEPPLGSGPYRIASVDAPRSIEYRRVDDYWGRDLPVTRGRFNFDVIRYEYFIGLGVEQGLVRSGLVDAGIDSASKSWANNYDIPSVHAGILRKEMLPVSTPTGIGGIAFTFNLRRPHFRDVRVREAISLLFDFEFNQRVIFWGEYLRVRSFFGDSPLESRGLPSADELALLEPYRGRIPERVFTTVYEPSRTAGIGHERTLLERAYRLLDDAGFRVVDGVRIDPATGEPLTVDFMLTTPVHERAIMPTIQRLRRVGVGATMRARESSQYQARLRSFEFDIAAIGWAAAYVPGIELRNRYGSAAARQQYSSNWAGIEDPVVDELVERVIGATSMRELVAAGRALDRVLLWNFYAMPGLKPRGARHVWWDRYGIPENKGTYRIAFPDAWWFDTERSARVDAWLRDGGSLGAVLAGD